jgi:tetratricopeptide (TPR) repeat protein
LTPARRGDQVTAVPLLAALLPLFVAAPPSKDPVREAERLAAAALVQAAEHPADALAEARQALSLTADFEPTAFVKAGRKGEVVEDVFIEARKSYRRHRARLYEAVGECLLQKGEPRPASRYLGRAVQLDPAPARISRLARALVTDGRGSEALVVLGRGKLDEVSPEMASVFAQAADTAGVPSAQVEVDRMRVGALEDAVAFRDGPFTLPSSVRLSSGALLQITTGVSVLYVAEASCRSCSEDLQALKRAVPADTRVLVIPEDPERDHALRQVLALYRYDWPVVMGKGVAGALDTKPRSVLVVARNGWAGVTVSPPFQASLPAVLKTFGRVDVHETIPRESWNRRPVERRGTTAPALLDDGIAPGEDEPAPPEFTAATEAFRSKRPAEALRLFEALDAKGDGWLLPPEARLDRALCLAAMGRRDEARRLLLKTGDSRFQDAVDRALEAIGSPPGKR